MVAQIHPEVLEETPPQFLSSWFFSGLSFVEQYGWFLLGGGIMLYYLRRKVEPYILRWRERREERNFAALCHKNPDLIRSRQEAMDAARLQLQMRHDEQAKIHAEKMKEREAKKKARQDAAVPSLGRRLGNGSSDQEPEKKSNYRPDYNPLMGSGSSGGYRAPRRSCPGGGCG
ncbi:Selenoprotein S [Blattella germanica]|nr:Selenoprotein S [Blattella germanica]